MRRCGRATTKAEFTQFKREFQKWYERLGLQDWHVLFQRGPVHDAYAEIDWDYDGMGARVTFADFIDPDGILGYNPKLTARHEALEFLIAPMHALAKWRHITPDQLAVESHRLIRRLEHLLNQVGA